MRWTGCWALVALVGVVGSACGDGSGSAGGVGGFAGTASAGVGGVGGVGGWGATGGTGGQSDPGALTAVLQVDGAMTRCGSCSAVTAQVSGGLAPYQYTWSDSSLSGPGPHTVCPQQPTDYTLTVTDTAILEGEFPRQAQTANDNAQVACTMPDVDAGVDPDAGNGTEYFTGCASQVRDGVDDLASMPNTACSMFPNGGVSSNSVALKRPLAAGRSYRLTIHRLFPLTIGAPVNLDFFGSDTMCEPQEAIGTIPLDAMPSNSICFTPTRDFTHLFHTVEIEGVLFNFDISLGATLCEEACHP